MIVDLAIAFLAFGAVLYGVLGEPRKDGKFTRIGKVIIGIAAIAFLFTVIKNFNDSAEKKILLASAEKIPDLNDQVFTLRSENEAIRKQNEQVLLATQNATRETQKLESAIIAIFKQIKVENDRVVVSLPNETVVKERGPLGQVINKTIPVDKHQISRTIEEFQGKMNSLERELLQRVNEIRELFDVLTASAEGLSE